MSKFGYHKNEPIVDLNNMAILPLVKEPTFRAEWHSNLQYSTLSDSALIFAALLIPFV